MRSLALLLSLSAAVAAGCLEVDDSAAPDAPNQLSDGKSDDNSPLWAGLTSIAMERYASDPCNNGARALGNDPVIYDSWARERASIRRVCFEVWSPGVTDTNNSNYWELLDVQAHFRFAGEPWRMEYVSSIDRRGNNRRYGFDLTWDNDPFVHGGSIISMTGPITLLNEGPEWAYARRDFEIYFTVNGRKLAAPSGEPFAIQYLGYVRTPKLTPKADGYVLTPRFDCNHGAAILGGGAGNIALDIHDQAAVAALDPNPGSLIYGLAFARAGAPGNEVASIVFANLDDQVPAPAVRNPDGLWIRTEGTTLHVKLGAFDRTTGQVRMLTADFPNCAAL